MVDVCSNSFPGPPRLFVFLGGFWASKVCCQVQLFILCACLVMRGIFRLQSLFARLAPAVSQCVIDTCSSPEALKEMNHIGSWLPVIEGATRLLGSSSFSDRVNIVLGKYRKNPIFFLIFFFSFNTNALFDKIRSVSELNRQIILNLSNCCEQKSNILSVLSYIVAP